MNCLGATTEYTTLFFIRAPLFQKKNIELTLYPVLLYSMKALKPVKFTTNYMLQPYKRIRVLLAPPHGPACGRPACGRDRECGGPAWPRGGRRAERASPELVYCGQPPYIFFPGSASDWEEINAGTLKFDRSTSEVSVLLIATMRVKEIVLSSIKQTGWL